MSDETETQEENAAADEPAGPVGGERLAEARRELQISVLEIAKELHLDEPKVRALERNVFDVLGAPVFAKGHLKAYAQLVNVDVADVLADYYQLHRAENAPPVITARRKPRRELSPGPWIAAIVVVIIVVSAYWWFSRPPQAVLDMPELQETDDTAVIPPPDSNDGAGTALPEAAGEVIDEPPVSQPDEQEEAEPAPVPEVEAGQLRLLVTYTGDCWTEITDASGRRLLFDLGKDGRTVELSGAEPFNVLFGNPGNVSLSVNGEDYALPPTNRPDRPMRLTISGS